MNTEQRVVCVVTGSRAEYGLLRGLMMAIRDSSVLRLQTIVTGAHLMERFGETWREIDNDGLAIDARVDIDLSDDTQLAVARSAGLGVDRIAQALQSLSPDLVVLLGDRYEIFAAAISAMILNIPIAHLHGGELTEGAIDDSIRHSITKMAHLHFTASDEYRRRIIQMGEDPARVFNTGATSIDAIAQTKLLDAASLSQYLGIDMTAPFFLVTYHPVTRERGDDVAARSLCDALDQFDGVSVLLTGVNADPGHDAVAKIFAKYVAQRPDRVKSFESLGHQRYLSAMALSQAVVGNSSSGILEAPAFGIPTVNIGPRQKGRVRADSVIDCGEGVEEIGEALIRSMDPAFRAVAKNASYPFGEPGAAGRIAALLAEAPLDDILDKQFYDIPLRGRV